MCIDLVVHDSAVCAEMPEVNEEERLAFEEGNISLSPVIAK